MEIAEIRGAWDTFLRSYEPLLRDRRYIDDLQRVNKPSVDDFGLQNLARLFEEEEAFFRGHDYRWALAPDAYFINMESQYQQRMLAMLADWWTNYRDRNAVDQDRLQRLVVRLIYTFDLRTATPLALVGGTGPRFILVPLGFIELILLIFRAAAASDKSHDALCKSLVCKAIAGALLDEPEDTRQLRLMERVLPQAVASLTDSFQYGDGVEWEAAEAGASWAVVDFILLHECGHFVFNHAPEDLNNYLKSEMQADMFALQAYAMSAGRRANLLAEAPNMVSMAAFGGPDCFMAAMIAWEQINLSLWRHLAALGNPSANTKCLQSADNIEKLSERFKSLELLVHQLGAPLIDEGAISPEDYSAYLRLKDSVQRVQAKCDDVIKADISLDALRGIEDLSRRIPGVIDGEADRLA